MAFMNYMADPTARTRSTLGIWVMLFMALFMATAWWLNKEYWKDVK